MSVTVGSLFSGIGGLDLGLERAGMNVIWQSEIDPYACQVLAKHWPTIPNHGDIKTIDWTQIERPNIICGGYPCQPFSQAGKRAGTDDPRHLWPWVKEAISHLRPDFAILENVRGHLSLGLTTVLGEMSQIGYDAEWQIISAAGVGAPHRRDRVFIVAYPNDSNPAHGRQRQNVSSQDQSWRDDGRGSRSNFGEVGVGVPGQLAGNVADSYGDRSQTQRGTFRDEKAFTGLGGDGADVPNADSFGLEGPRPEQQATRSAGNDKEINGNVADPNLWETGWGDWRHAAGRSEVLGWRDIGRRTAGYEGWQWWETEPDVGRVANGVPSRVDRLKCLGNAVVPQVSEFVGRIVMECYQ